MKTILYILNRASVSGPTFHVAYLSKYLNNSFNSIILYGMLEEGEGDGTYIFNEHDVKFDRIPSMYRAINLYNDLKALVFIIKTINQLKPDIIHTHAAKAGALGRISCLFTRHKPKVILHTYHGNVFEGYFSTFKSWVFLVIERVLAKISTGIITLSNKQKEDIVSKYKISNSLKTVVIPLGLKLEIFQQNNVKKRKITRAELKLDEQTVLIVITGRLTEIKNHKFFLEIISFCKRNSNLDFKCLVVGDGELYNYLIDYAKSLDLIVADFPPMNSSYDIYFTSWRKDVDCINAAADIAVLTSLNEGTPCSIIEAMAAGKAIITTNVGGVGDFVFNGVNGFVVENNLEVYSSKLMELIKSKDLREKFGSKAKDVAFRMFSNDRMVEDMERYYLEMLKSQS